MNICRGRWVKAMPGQLVSESFIGAGNTVTVSALFS